VSFAGEQAAMLNAVGRVRPKAASCPSYSRQYIPAGKLFFQVKILYFALKKLYFHINAAYER